jgi:hypothetical protein
VLLPLINSDDVSVLEALDIPEPRLEKRTDHAREACK